MKLTNDIRNAFVAAAMQDVPSPKDYANIIEDAVRADIVAQLPPEVKKVWKDAGLRGFVRTNLFRGFGVRMHVPSQSAGWADMDERVISEKERARLKALQVEWDKHRGVRDELRDKLRAAAYGCTTRKALVELLPEFERYLPPEAGPTSRATPVVQNMVADFVKAGWPKNKETPHA